MPWKCSLWISCHGRTERKPPLNQCFACRPETLRGVNFKRGQTADESVALAISKAARLKRVAEVSVADAATVASKRRKKRIPSAAQISVADTATLASAAAQSSVAVTATVASAAAQITVADAVEMKEEKAPSTRALAGEAALSAMQVLEMAEGDKRTTFSVVASGRTTPPPRARTPALSPTIVVPLRAGPRAALPAAPGY
jgi:predicted pyridoxine 5'-phosphate oxidase superfamily flavin-nucleotide-binding protein